MLFILTAVTHVPLSPLTGCALVRHVPDLTGQGRKAKVTWSYIVPSRETSKARRSRSADLAARPTRVEVGVVVTGQPASNFSGLI